MRGRISFKDGRVGIGKVSRRLAVVERPAPTGHTRSVASCPALLNASLHLGQANVLAECGQLGRRGPDSIDSGRTPGWVRAEWVRAWTNLKFDFYFAFHLSKLYPKVVHA